MNHEVYLRAFEADDYRATHPWRQDPEVYHLTTGNKFHVSLERERQWVFQKATDDSRDVYWAICDAQTHQMVGYLGIDRIDWRSRKANWCALIIGEKAYRNMHVTTQAIFLMLEHFFDQMNMHRLYSHQLADHKPAILLNRMVGFRKEGLLREALFKHGRYHDLLLIAMLREDYDRLRLRRAEENLPAPAEPE